MLQITTTPSLFNVNNVKHDNFKANANIIAQFPCGPQSVERIEIDTSHVCLKLLIK